MRDLLRFLKAFKKWADAGHPSAREYVGDKFVDLNPNNFSKRVGLCANAARYDRSHVRENGRMTNAHDQLTDLLRKRYPETYLFPFNEYVDDPMYGSGQRNTYYDDCDHVLGVWSNVKRRQFVGYTILELSTKIKGR